MTTYDIWTAIAITAAIAAALRVIFHPMPMTDHDVRRVMRQAFEDDIQEDDHAA